MACSQCQEIQQFGADPATIKWTLVRGDTGTIQFGFFEDDEITPMNMTGWTYKATAYNPVTQEFFELVVEEGDPGYVNVIALPEQTTTWGTGIKTIVAELSFDLEITIAGERVWTPIIGTICVLGDISSRGSL